MTCGNITVKLGLSAHNKLQKQILEEFVPNFASGSELLYIGDTSDRTLQRDDKRLSELGIKILEDTSKLPDIIYMMPIKIGSYMWKHIPVPGNLIKIESIILIHIAHIKMILKLHL